MLAANSLTFAGTRTMRMGKILSGFFTYDNASIANFTFERRTHRLENGPAKSVLLGTRRNFFDIVRHRALSQRKMKAGGGGRRKTVWNQSRSATAQPDLHRTPAEHQIYRMTLPGQGPPNIFIFVLQTNF